MAPESNHLIVEKGPDSGRKILIPAGGARAGRSSNNDIVLNDPAMSRFHCRFFFKPGAGLWAEDLGSANQTLLNDHPLSASALQVGDRLLMGDTLLQVLNVEEPMPDLFSAAAPPSGSIAFRRRGGGERPAGRQRLALWGGGLLLVAAGLIVVSGIFRSAPLSETPVTNHTRLEIAYEKVQANSNNIFRYQMRLSDNELSIQIDDLQTRRHVLGNQRKRVEAELLQSLAAALRHTGFYELKEEYLGLASDVWDLWDLTITLGQQTHRVKILNTLEPEAFRITRETIEEFGQNELGLAALALAPEKLLNLARDAVLLGRNLYDQRNIKHEDLAMAIRALREA
ncbi:MAG: FHA domain-containing protein, partial [Lentisphaerae bacterium]|nr:FHA domain-containing protein [Lentisphaerota bacterium]